MPSLPVDKLWYNKIIGREEVMLYGKSPEGVRQHPIFGVVLKGESLKRHLRNKRETFSPWEEEN